MNTLFNAGSEYEILDRGGNNLLLRRVSDNQFVIAHGWRGEGKGWDAGKYFGDNEESARETFEQYKSPSSYGYN